MPITPSHAVVALPFVRSPLQPAAIAVGAMAPDLPLFVRATPLSYAVTHDFAWVALTAFVAFVLLLVWRMLLRPAARELSPRWLAARLPGGWRVPARTGVVETLSLHGQVSASWRGVGILAISLVIGVVSHITWDLFTHEGRWGAAVLPVIGERWGPLPGYSWLQHGSSVVGGVILLGCAAWWLRRATATASVDRVFGSWVRWAWWLSLPLTLVVAWAVGLAVSGPLTTQFTVAHLGYRVLPPAVAVWGVVTAALCLAVQLRARRRRSGSAVDGNADGGADFSG